MKQVRAKATGFYNGARVYAGQLFSVPDEFNGSWFEAEGEAAAPKRRRRRRAEAEAAPEPETAVAEETASEE
jgi:hypothetical protein